MSGPTSVTSLTSGLNPHAVPFVPRPTIIGDEGQWVGSQLSSPNTSGIPYPIL
ncbi:hypothetical protein P691DRAFT_769673 [Macrolepiota fuliginosa MF-IS2]|uniref:Uncharacterized protein n=1 Tax=Macrolepiota fuliginosa MF-IS2 TaxID=1400762 RepID=A0A9P5WY50_9AGAR|nr:hypothetical protein P691DRAFT_769673 [Macrolepiota fuliginosa MF-IS2]